MSYKIHRKSCLIWESPFLRNAIGELILAGASTPQIHIKRWEILDEGIGCDCDNPSLSILEKEVELLLRSKKGVSYRHIFLTISLPIDYDVTTLSNFDPTILKLKPADYAWCFEFFGKDLQFHPHCHLLVKTETKLDKKRLINRLVKYFNIKSNFVDYEYGASAPLYKKRLQYIKGVKTGSKTPQILLDEEKRILLKLKSYYIV